MKLSIGRSEPARDRVAEGDGVGRLRGKLLQNSCQATEGVRAAQPAGILSHPVLHFALIGGLLFAASQLMPEDVWRSETREPIRVSASDIQQQRHVWARETARPPTATELQASLRRHLDEELLFREALRLGLDARDKVARERLILNMRFAFPEATDDDEQLLQEARRLGMNTRDLVVRRRLIQAMEQRIVSRATVTEAELGAHVVLHAARYGRPQRFDLRHFFFSHDVPRAKAVVEARARLTGLNAGRGDPDAGDPFLLGARFNSASRADLVRIFGEDFARAVAQATPGTWTGPVQSPYGLHLIRVDRIEAERDPELAAVRTRAAYALLAEREMQLLREELARLRKRYRIETEGLLALTP